MIMSNKEIEDLKTLIKALDIRLKADEISEEEYKELKRKYEEKLKEEVLAVKESSFLKNLSYVSISGSGKVTDSYISISGSGRIEGWRNGTITISGSGKITDEEIKISGSGTLPGGLKAESIAVSGSVKAEGSLEASKFASSGSIKIEGPLTVQDKFATSGSGKIDGTLNAETASVASSGALKINGDLLCREAELTGSYRVNGSVQCKGDFSSELNDLCRIQDDLVCAGNVYIEQHSRKGILKVGNIFSEGEVYLEGVEAKTVRGKKVKLGPECKVDSIEEMS
jgi:cytoskeletal protein CcmA (bactofilin family)